MMSAKRGTESAKVGCSKKGTRLASPGTCAGEGALWGWRADRGPGIGQIHALIRQHLAAMGGSRCSSGASRARGAASGAAGTLFSRPISAAD